MGRGAKVRVVRIPAADDGSKQGVDDLVAQRRRCPSSSSIPKNRSAEAFSNFSRFD